MKLHPLLGSSADENKLSLTIKGLLIGAVPFIVYLCNEKGIDLTPNEITELINKIFVVVSSITALIGLGRKIHIKFKR